MREDTLSPGLEAYNPMPCLNEPPVDEDFAKHAGAAGWLA